MTKTMLDAPLELPNIATSVFAGVNSATVTLSAGPLAREHVSSVESVNPITVAKPLPILAPVTATSGPGLNTIAIVLAVKPVTFKPAAHGIVVDAAAGALSLVKLSLVNVTVAIELDPAPRASPPVRFRARADGPENGQMVGRRGGEGTCEEQSDRRESRDGEIQGEEKGGGETKGGEKINKERASGMGEEEIGEREEK